MFAIPGPSVQGGSHNSAIALSLADSWSGKWTADRPALLLPPLLWGLRRTWSFWALIGATYVVRFGLLWFSFCIDKVCHSLGLMSPQWFSTLLQRCLQPDASLPPCHATPIPMRFDPTGLNCADRMDSIQTQFQLRFHFHFQCHCQDRFGPTAGACRIGFVWVRALICCDK